MPEPLVSNTLERFLEGERTLRGDGLMGSDAI